jgi:AraC-like DNA-binding protein
MGGVIDALSGMLSNLRLRAIFFGPSQAAAPWGIDFQWPPRFDKMPAPPVPFPSSSQRGPIPPVGAQGGVFLGVMEGTVVLQIPGSEVITLNAGDLLILPKIKSHSIKDHPSSPTLPVWHYIHREPGNIHAGMEVPGKGAISRFMHGLLIVEDSDLVGLLNILPESILLRGISGRFDRWVGATMALLDEELQHRGPGSGAIVSQLASVMYVTAIRKHLESMPMLDETDFRVLNDPDVGRVVAMVHARPELEWTVANLGDAALMSRSVFAEKFTQLVGQSPMQYVTRVRMMRAARLLAGGISVKEAAGRVGYGSETAFSAAYKRQFGHTPGNTPRESTAPGLESMGQAE